MNGTPPEGVGALATPRILLVEGSGTQARFLEQTLRAMDPAPAEVRWVESLARALQRLDDSVDLVLLDLVLSDSTGIDTFRALHEARPLLPIIVLSGADDEALALLAVAEGAQDYLFKGAASPDVLARSIRFALERHRTLEVFRRAAMYDELTGLYNRRGFTVMAGQQLAVARRNQTTSTVLFADVDGLKAVNDALGHRHGDLLLADLARLMQATFRAGDVVGRVGGDEFCAVLVDDDNVNAAAGRLRQAILEHNAGAGRRYHLSCSVGTVSVEATDDAALSDILSRADQVMYEQKRSRRHSRDTRPTIAPG